MILNSPRCSEADHSEHNEENKPTCREACVRQVQGLAGEDSDSK